MHCVYPIARRTQRGRPSAPLGPPQAAARRISPQDAAPHMTRRLAICGLILDVGHYAVAPLDVEIQAHAGQAILVLHGDLDFGFMVIEGCSLRRRDTRRSTRRPADANGEDTIISDTTTASAESAVRPFRIEVPQGEIDELRRRINATRWPTRELVTDRSQGVQLAAIQNLARYFYIVAAYLAGAAR